MYLIFFFIFHQDGHYKVETLVSGYETSMKLTIRSVRSQDFGAFRCVATNSLGETDGRIKLYSEYILKLNLKRWFGNSENKALIDNVNL